MIDATEIEIAVRVVVDPSQSLAVVPDRTRVDEQAGITGVSEEGPRNACANAGCRAASVV